MTDTPRRLTAAFHAIADAVKADGWRLVTDPVVRRDARLRATGAAFRRVCDDGSIDCIMVGLTDNIGDPLPLGDVEPLVRDGILVLRGRPIATVSPIEFNFKHRAMYAWREDALYTGDEMEANRKGAYERGKRDGLADAMRDTWILGHDPGWGDGSATVLMRGTPETGWTVVKEDVKRTNKKASVVFDNEDLLSMFSTLSGAVDMKPVALTAATFVSAYEEAERRRSARETTTTTLADLTRGTPALEIDDGNVYPQFKLAKCDHGVAAKGPGADGVSVYCNTCCAWVTS